MDKARIYASLLKKFALFYVKYSPHSSAVSLLNHIRYLAINSTHRIIVQISQRNPPQMLPFRHGDGIAHPGVDRDLEMSVGVLEYAKLGARTLHTKPQLVS